MQILDNLINSFPELDYNHPHINNSGYDTYGEKIKLNLIVNLIKEKKISTVLDVGCHTGNISIPLAHLGIDVLGIDIDIKDIEGAKKRDPKKLARFETTDFFEIEDHFEMILFCDVLEHVENPDIYITKAYSSLKDSGWLVISIPNGFGPFELLLDIPMQIIRKLFHREMPPGENHIQFFTMKNIKDLTKHKFTFDQATSFCLINFLPPFNKSQILTNIDYYLSRKLPYSMTSRWLIFLKK